MIESREDTKGGKGNSKGAVYLIEDKDGRQKIFPKKTDLNDSQISALPPDVDLWTNIKLRHNIFMRNMLSSASPTADTYTYMVSLSSLIKKKA